MNESSTQPIIELNNVDKFFGDFQALKNINLSVDVGEKVVVCGPSGSGKSTMIRCINHIESHDAGTITVDGIELTEDMNNVLTIRREVGMVFQQFNLFPHLTVLENLTLAPMKARRLSSKEANDIAMQYLERVQIPEQANKYPSQLSGGQQQRVAIARSLCMRPKIMLFDEPTSALDVSIQAQILNLLKDIQDELHLAMLFISHDLPVIRQMCNRIVVLKNGSVCETKESEELFNNPEHPYTQELIRLMPKIESII